jgi:hypothetical protein
VWGKDYEAQNRIFRALRISQEFREGCDRFKVHARLHSYRRKNGSVLETRVVGSGSVMSNSPEDKERITRILMTGMSDEQLRLIGQIAVIWNNNKFLFEELIWRAAKWEPEARVLVTADCQACHARLSLRTSFKSKSQTKNGKSMRLRPLPCLSRPELRETT